MRKTLGTLVLAGALALGSSSIAHAQHGEGAFRLHADFSVFDVSAYPGFGDATILVGVLSPPGPFFGGLGLGLGAGYQFSDMFVIGGRIGFGYVDVAAPGGTPSGAGLLSLVPYFEILFTEGDVIPFAGAQAGFQVAFPEASDARAGLLAGLYGGVHLFPVDAFSISPQLWLDFLYNGFTERAGFDIGIIVTLTGWIGGSGGGGGETTPATEEPPPPSYY
jgi:hypothetical protein